MYRRVAALGEQEMLRNIEQEIFIAGIVSWLSCVG